MKAEGFLERLSGITVWKRAGERAPHKPLLLLMAMGGAVRGEDRLVRYSEIDNALTGLLKHFGPPRQVQHPEFPFGRLVRDGLWEIPEEASLRRTRSGDLLRAELIARGITGGLPEPLYRLLTDNLRTVQLAAGRILDAHFPISMHQHILEAVGLDGLADAETTSQQSKRDPRFRSVVLAAYERNCAVCGFDLRLEDDLLGLEAAHIRWHSHGGPDHVTNGLALCTFHHGAFDRGAIGLKESTKGSGYRVIVSPLVNGESAARDWLRDYDGKSLRPAQSGAQVPDAAYVAWHAKQVFRAVPAGLSGRGMG